MKGTSWKRFGSNLIPTPRHLRFGNSCTVSWEDVFAMLGNLRPSEPCPPYETQLAPIRTPRCVIRSLRWRGLWLGGNRNYSINQFPNQTITQSIDEWNKQSINDQSSSQSINQPIKQSILLVETIVDTIICCNQLIRLSVDLNCWNDLLRLSADTSCWDDLLGSTVRLSVETNCWDYLLSLSVEINCSDSLFNCWSA